MNLTPKEKNTVKAVFVELLIKPYRELNTFLGHTTIVEMAKLYYKLRYEKYCEDRGIRFEDMTEIDFLYADDEIRREETKEQKMKRFDTLTEEAKEVFYKTLEAAKVRGRSDFRCGLIDCAFCPFDNERDSCYQYRTVEEWEDWVIEEVEEGN